MKLLATIALLVAGFLAWQFAGLIGPAALGMAIGVVIGVLAGAPTGMLVLAASRRRDEQIPQRIAMLPPAPSARVSIVEPKRERLPVRFL
jgi:hypothetical protein